MTWNDILKEDKPEFGKPLPYDIKQFCDNCGMYVIVPKGEIYGQNTSKFCINCGDKGEKSWQDYLQRHLEREDKHLGDLI